jgi:Arc/MetJ-type ribon-helix-helix transcriptional regulator
MGRYWNSRHHHVIAPPLLLAHSRNALDDAANHAAYAPTIRLDRARSLLKAVRPPSIYHPNRWYRDGNSMTPVIQQLRPKPGDSEKITINLGYVDLGQIDLMVQEGFYSNRTDFIRSAIRNQLERHADVVKQSTVRKSLDLGLRHYSREDLEAARQAGQMLQIHVLGLASIALDVTPELARATIASVVVLGSLHASPAVKDVLADRMR